MVDAVKQNKKNTQYLRDDTETAYVRRRRRCLIYIIVYSALFAAAAAVLVDLRHYRRRD